MQEGKVVVGMGLLIGLGDLLELSHHRVEGPLLIEPMLKEMHAHIEHTGLDSDDLGASDRWPMKRRVVRAALGAAELPPPS
jgi:hypothetical protein